MDIDPAEGTSSQRANKRTNETIYVDPDTGKEIANPKRPKITLDPGKKVKCLKAVINAYLAILNLFFPDGARTETIAMNITLSNQITSILITAHNFFRQQHTTPNSNLRKKATLSDYKVHSNGADISHAREAVNKQWLKACKDAGLEYKAYAADNEENWYGTMGPYLNFFSANALRKKELRIGHSMVPIQKDGEGNIKVVPITKYGLNGAHHVLLEGCTYPPERRASMVQSLGPLTSLIVMIRTTGIYRQKWENAVRRCCAHIPGIDDVITLTRSAKSASELATLVSLIGDILLVTSGRQAMRMTFPLNVFCAGYHMVPDADKEKFLKGFNTSGVGGFYLYKLVQDRAFIVEGNFTEEQAQQIVFHTIFGTYKEDLGVLSQITNVRNWYTREEIGKNFQKSTNSGRQVKFHLPTLKYFSKLCSANQTGLLASNYPQVSSVQCFSGSRVIEDSDAFFHHLRRRQTTAAASKTIGQCVALLSTTLQELITIIEGQKGNRESGTTAWYSMEHLDLESRGEPTNLVVKTTNKYFMGRKE